MYFKRISMVYDASELEKFLDITDLHHDLAMGRKYLLHYTEWGTFIPPRIFLSHIVDEMTAVDRTDLAEMRKAMVRVFGTDDNQFTRGVFDAITASEASKVCTLLNYAAKLVHEYKFGVAA